MKYDRIVIAYHGCDRAVAERLLLGESFVRSENDYDWLGEGVYFWEYGADRALQFAEEQRRRGKLAEPAVVGALVQLGDCFDLMDTRFTRELPGAFETLREIHEGSGTPMPRNAGATPDKLLRRLDCAVLNFYFRRIARRGVSYDTVRCGFVEGAPAYEGSGIHHQRTCRSRSEIRLASSGCSGPQSSHE